MEKILGKCLEPDLLPASDSDVYQLQILLSGIPEQLMLQQNQDQVIESHCFLQCDDEAVSKGCLPSTSISSPLDSDNCRTLGLNFGPQVEEFHPLTTLGDSQSRGAPLDKNSDIIVSLASPPPPSPSPSPSPSAPHSPLPSSLPSHSGSTTPKPGYPTYSPPRSPSSEPSPTPTPTPTPRRDSPHSPPRPPGSPPLSPPLLDSPYPTLPDSPQSPPRPPGSPPRPPGSPPPTPPLPDSPYPYPSPSDSPRM